MNLENPQISTDGNRDKPTLETNNHDLHFSKLVGKAIRHFLKSFPQTLSFSREPNSDVAKDSDSQSGTDCVTPNGLSDERDSKLGDGPYEINAKKCIEKLLETSGYHIETHNTSIILLLWQT